MITYITGNLCVRNIYEERLMHKPEIEIFKKNRSAINGKNLYLKIFSWMKERNRHNAPVCNVINLKIVLLLLLF